MSSEGRVCAVKSQPITGTYTLTGYAYDAGCPIHARLLRMSGDQLTPA